MFYGKEEEIWRAAAGIQSDGGGSPLVGDIVRSTPAAFLNRCFSQAPFVAMLAPDSFDSLAEVHLGMLAWIGLCLLCLVVQASSQKTIPSPTKKSYQNVPFQVPPLPVLLLQPSSRHGLPGRPLRRGPGEEHLRRGGLQRRGLRRGLRGSEAPRSSGGGGAGGDQVWRAGDGICQSCSLMFGVRSRRPIQSCHWVSPFQVSYNVGKFIF